MTGIHTATTRTRATSFHPGLALRPGGAQANSPGREPGDVGDRIKTQPRRGVVVPRATVMFIVKQIPFLKFDTVPIQQRNELFSDFQANPVAAVFGSENDVAGSHV
jgi:hypothetical protein